MLLLAKQQSRLCLYADVGTLLGTVVGLGMALPHGLTVYLGVMSGFQSITVGYLSFWLLRHRALSARGIFHAFFVPLVACLAAWGILLIPKSLLFNDLNFTLFGAIGWGLSFSFFYLLIIRMCFKLELKELVNCLPMNQRLSRLLYIK